MDAAIDEFIAVTAAPRADAAAYVEAAGGDVASALEAFYDAGAGEGAAPSAPPAAAAPVSNPAPRPAARGGGGGGGSNVRSLADLAADDATDDDDDANEYYAGGQKSGQVVRGAPQGPPTDADALFDAARAAGARDGTAADLAPAGGGGGSSAAFTGTARTLAGGDSAAPEAAGAGTGATPAAAPPPPPAPTVITFYDDGVFTVGPDGAPRHMDDPAEAAFMAALARGECPAELDPGRGGAPVAVNLVRAGKAYEPPPKPAYVAFSGAGRTLAGGGGEGGDAGPSNAAVAAAAAAAPPPAAAPGGGWSGPDESRPVTSLQLRLADGTRLVARFNTDATLAAVRAFVAASRPDGPARYILMAGVPPAPLDEGGDAAGRTLEEAGLVNAVIVQRAV